MPDEVAFARGAEDCRASLFSDGRVVIERGGFFARQRHGARTELLLGDLGDVSITPPRLGIRGVFELVPRGASPLGGFAANNTSPNACYFTEHQRAGFEGLRRAILDALGAAGRVGPVAATSSKSVLVVLTARPRGEGVADLNVDLEERVIIEELQRVDLGDQIDLRLRPAASADNLLNDVLENRPSILHFSGHGLIEGVIVEGPGRSAVLASDSALLRVCAVPEVAAHLQLLVLNACLSAPQARTLAGSVPAVVGTLDSVLDNAAIGFARGFYNALGRGLAVSSAFAAGSAACALAAGELEADKYVIYQRGDVDLSQMAFASVPR